MMMMRAFVLSLCLLYSHMALAISFSKPNLAPEEKYQELLTAIETATGPQGPFYTLAINALVDNQPEDIYELAYATAGYSDYLSRDIPLGQFLLSLPAVQAEPFAQAFSDFLQKRSLKKAHALLDIADTPRERALAFMCLAESSYAQADGPKTLLYSLLSLGTHQAKMYDAQTQGYTADLLGAPLSLLQDQASLFEEISARMENETNAKRFRLLFDMATVVGLLPEYPLNPVPTDQQNAPLAVCVIFDNNYAQHASTTLLSAILSAKPSTRYDFYALDDASNPLNEENKKALQLLVKLFGDDRFTLRFVSIDESMLPPQVHKLTTKWPRNVYFKMLIPSLFTDKDKVLYMDTDILVRKDLTDLFQVPLGQNLIAGTRDVNGNKRREDLGEDVNGPYVNGGVVLFHVAQFKAENKLNVLHDVFANTPEVIECLKFNEQDLMSLLFTDQTLELAKQTCMSEEDKDCKSIWNWFAQPHFTTHWSRIHRHFAGIIHMESNVMKPWRRKSWSLHWWNNDPRRNDGIQDMYFALRDMGPWSTRMKRR